VYVNWGGVVAAWSPSEKASFC